MNTPLPTALPTAPEQPADLPLRPWAIADVTRRADGLYDVVFAWGNERADQYVRAKLEVRFYVERGLAYLSAVNVWDVRADLATTLEIERFVRRNEELVADAALAADCEAA